MTPPYGCARRVSVDRLIPVAQIIGRTLWLDIRFKSRQEYQLTQVDTHYRVYIYNLFNNEDAHILPDKILEQGLAIEYIKIDKQHFVESICDCSSLGKIVIIVVTKWLTDH